ncbi:MAG: PIN domain-containing protein, partial [Pseudomonadota bacterium]
MTVITLVPDTNVFIQCKVLNELPWEEEFDAFDTVTLVVTRALQKEIDHQKNRGNDRVGRRARKAATLFKGMIVENMEHVVREENPRVTLVMRADIKPDEERRSELDMTEPDDQIVACGCTLASQEADSDVRLLTHDSGPMATAQLVGLPFYPVPDHWLSPPEPSPSEKKVHALEQEVKRLKQDEPVVTVHCLDAQGN